MPVEVTARHMKVRAAVQEYGRGLGELLIEEFPRVENVHLVLDIGKRHQHLAGVFVQGRGRGRFESMEASESMRAAIDAAFAKAEAHLRKILARARDLKKTSGRVSPLRARRYEEA